MKCYYKSKLDTRQKNWIHRIKHIAKYSSSATIKHMKFTRFGIISATLLLLPTAHASECLFNRCFVGVEYECQFPTAFNSIAIGQGIPDVSRDFLKRSNSAYTINAGYRFYDIGFRIGYTYSQEIKYQDTILNAAADGQIMGTGYITQKSNNVFIDGIYFYKFGPCMEFKFLLGAGGMWTSFNSTLYGTYAGYYIERSFGPGFRIGVGTQYQLNSYLVGDIILKCQVPGNETFKYITSLSIGLSFFI